MEGKTIFGNQGVTALDIITGGSLEIDSLSESAPSGQSKNFSVSCFSLDSNRKLKTTSRYPATLLRNLEELTSAEASHCFPPAEAPSLIVSAVGKLRLAQLCVPQAGSK